MPVTESGWRLQTHLKTARVTSATISLTVNLAPCHAAVQRHLCIHRSRRSRIYSVRNRYHPRGEHRYMLGSLSARQGLFHSMYIPISRHIDYNSHLYKQHFSLTYGHTHRNDDLSVRITTDGLRSSKFIKRSKTGQRRNTVNGVSTSPTSMRPYMFSRLQLTGTLAP